MRVPSISHLVAIAAVALSVTALPEPGKGKDASNSASGSLPYWDLGNTLRSAWGTPKNSYPLVLVHGLFGFGKPLLGVLNYWGGAFGDTQKKLQSYGYQVSVADIGPVSSNWERACELYAQIKGTRVDYGAARSKKFGHARYGRDYTGQGFYPQWGTAPDAKINLITHSMGGQTGPLFVSLLGQGSAEEVAASPDDVSPLFWTNKTAGTYVNGLLSLNGVLRGASIASFLSHIDLFKTIATAIVGVTYLDPAIYDIKLDQWGLQWTKGESFSDFVNRLFASPWAASKSNALYDLSVEGTNDALNAFVKPEPDVYYFSFASYGTAHNFLTGTEFATPAIDLLLQPTSNIIGATTIPRLGVDQSWFQNDGIVSVVSMTHSNSDKNYKGVWGNIDLSFDASKLWFWPIGKPSAPSNKPVKGVWQPVGQAIAGFDHIATVGALSPSPNDAYTIAENAMAILSSTP